MSSAGIQPIGVGTVTSSDNGRDRSGCNWDHFGLIVKLFETVSESGYSQVGRGVATDTCIAFQSGYFGVSDQVDLFAGGKVDPVFGDDTMSGRVGSSSQGCQSCSSICLHIVVVRTGIIYALIHETAKSVWRKIAGKTIQIVSPHLADDNIDDQFGFSGLLGGNRAGTKQCQQHGWQNVWFHVLIFQVWLCWSPWFKANLCKSQR